MSLRSLKNHLSKYMLIYVLLSMGIGLAVGYPAAGFVHSHKSTLTTLTTVAVFLIIYPMVINVVQESLRVYPDGGEDDYSRKGS